MGVCTEDYEITRWEQIVTLRILHDIDDREMIGCIAQTLKTYLADRSAKHGLMCLLIDLRDCKTFKGTHVMSTVGILMGEKDAVLAHVCGSAVLMAYNVTIDPLRKMFERLYQPVRPFSIFMDPAQANAFLLNVRSTP
jgi:hypothetical protein